MGLLDTRENGMPAALERKLKRKAAEKGFKGEKRDAYVYGTLRKTGWKPEREKKMNTPSKLVRLEQIDKHLDSTIRFAYGDEEDRRKSLLGSAATGGALVGAGAAGTLAHQAIRSSGGYGANWAGAKLGYKLAGTTGTGMPDTFGAKAGQLAGRAGKYGQSALGKLRNVFTPSMLARLKLWSAKEEPMIKFDRISSPEGIKKEPILEPFSEGAVPNSEIIREQYPAALSPAALMKLPFPQLMRYLNRPNQLQQQWSGFSRIERLIKLSSKLDEITLEDKEESKAAKLARYGLVGAAGLTLGWQGIKAHRLIKAVGGYRTVGSRIRTGKWPE